MTPLEHIAEERRRQIEKHGWTHEHDDTHEEQELMRAAMCYLDFEGGESVDMAASNWPWAHLGDEGFKPDLKDPIRNLVKSCALLVAEIERLQRAQVRAEKPTELEGLLQRAKDPLMQRAQSATEGQG